MRGACLLFVVLALTWAGDAFAAPACGNNPRTCSQSEAATDAEQYAREYGTTFCVAPAYGPFQVAEIYQHTPEGSGTGRYSGRFMCKQQDGTPSTVWRYTGIPSYYKNDCATRAPVTETNHPNNALQCNKGCEHRFFTQAPNSNGIVFARGIATGKTCNPDNYTCPQGYRPGRAPPGWLTSRDCVPLVPDKCPEGQVLVDGVCKRPEACPEGMVQNPDGSCAPSAEECPAGQVKGPDGSCVNDTKCPAGQVRGKDGTCKNDADGDGKPDAAEDDGKFSGGDSCKEPPQCSGDNILCGQARIQWRIDCNTRRNVNISGGGCNAEPICVGEKCDALEYAQLLQQWRATCTLEKLNAKTAGNGDGQPEWTKVNGMNQDPGQGSRPGDTNIFAPTEVVDGSKLDATAFVGGGGSCPGIPTPGSAGPLLTGFMAMASSPPVFWCNFISMCGAMIALFGLISSIYILART